MPANETIEILNEILMKTLVGVTDCLNMATLMYLFYFQGKKIQSKIT